MINEKCPCRRGSSDSDSNEDEEVEGAGNRQATLLSLPSI